MPKLTSDFLSVMVGFIFAARAPGHGGGVVAAACVRGKSAFSLCLCFLLHVVRNSLWVRLWANLIRGDGPRTRCGVVVVAVDADELFG